MYSSIQMTEDKPVFSCIIATYNAEMYLSQAIDSVLGQTTENFELIIIDGLSTDRTVEIVKSYGGRIRYFVSEKDNGIYDAWNKGIKASKGDWILFLGADDLLVPSALAVYYDNICKNNLHKVDFISGKVNYVKYDLTPLILIGKPWSWPNFQHEMTVAHVGSLHNRELFTETGLYNTEYRIVGDYELLLRKKGLLKTYYVDYVFALMREGGVSFSYKAIQESINARIMSGGETKFRSFFDRILLPLFGWLHFVRIRSRLCRRFRKLN